VKNKAGNKDIFKISRFEIKRDLIITFSSPSHDLSNLLFFEKYKENLSLYSVHLFFFLNKPSKYINNNPKEIYKFINSNKIRLIKIDNNYFSRLYGFLVMYLIILKTLIKKILNIFIIKKINSSLLVVQPRPYWLKERFGFLSKLIFNYETIIIGDGVGSECLTKKPIWLKKFEANNYTKEKIISSYYIFSPSRQKDLPYLKEISFYKYSRDECKNCFKKYIKFLLTSRIRNDLDSFINKIILNTDEIFFLLTSTFSEYGRCSLESEINLYKKELKNLTLSLNNKKIIIKPHPLSSNKKNNSLLSIQKEIYFANSELKEAISKNFTLISYIPIEVLITMLTSKRINISILSCSAALIPSIYAYPQIKYKILFGSGKIEKAFTNEDEIIKRNNQEESIKYICSTIQKRIK
tara:strand:+ start:12363 stop:13589 length:1227 start_codon:yes stop_codon:yes gene_type:complete